MADCSQQAEDNMELQPVELNDGDWSKFKREFDIAKWDADCLGQRRVGVALVGLGRIGLVHLRGLFRLPRAQLLYCFDLDPARLDACRKSMFFRHFSVQALDSSQFNVALADARVQAVIVASPTSTHEQLVRRALEARKSVLCEKPLTLEFESIMALYALAHAQRRFLATAFNRHYDADWQRMRARAKSNALGPVHLIRIVSRNGQRPSMAYLKTSGNCFYDTAIHDLDMMLWLMRQLPCALQVVAKTWQQFFQSDPDFLRRLTGEERAHLPQISDYFLVAITLQFPNGSIGLIDTSRLSSYGNDQRCEIYGSAGMLKCDGALSSNVYESTGQRVANAGINYTFESRYARAYEAELDDFLTMADLAQRDLFENRAEVAARLADVPRGTLVAAATRLAELCSQAAKSPAGHANVEWPKEFEQKFYEEINL